MLPRAVRPRLAPGGPARPAARADPRARRRDGHDAPGTRLQRGRLPRRALPRPPARPAGRQRPAVPDPAGRRPGDPSRRTWTPARTSSPRTRSPRPASPRPTTGFEPAVVREINVAAARLARDAADAAERGEPGRPRFVAGSLGPTNRTASMSSDVGDPAARSVTWEELAVAYREAAAGLVEGGADILLDRDDLRHAQRQGRDLRRRGPVRGDRRAAAADHLRHDRRRVRPDALGPDASRRSGTASATPSRSSSGLNCALGAEAAARASRRAVARRRPAHLRLPERGPAQRARRLRRDARADGRRARGVGPARPAQRRRRLLRVAPLPTSPPSPRPSPACRRARSPPPAGTTRLSGLERRSSSRRRATPSSTSASGPTSPARASSPGSSPPARRTRRSRSPASRSATAPR